MTAHIMLQAAGFSGVSTAFDGTVPTQNDDRDYIFEMVLSWVWSPS